MKRAIITCVCSILLLIGETNAQGTLKQIVDNGPRSNRLNLVIFGDGLYLGARIAF